MRYCIAAIKTTRAESRHAVQNNKSNSEKPFTLSSNIKLYSKNKMYISNIYIYIVCYVYIILHNI